MMELALTLSITHSLSQIFTWDPSKKPEPSIDTNKPPPKPPEMLHNW